MSALQTGGSVSGSEVVQGIAAAQTDWAVVTLKKPSGASTGGGQATPPQASGGASESAEPFAQFQNSTPKPASAPQGSVAAATPAQPASPSKSGGKLVLNVVCMGELHRKTGSLVVQKVPFEFRTVVDTGAKKHRVANVVQGPLMQSGITYDALPMVDDIVRLSAEMTSKQHWSITSVQLDLSSSRLTGRGTVDLTQARGRINSFLSKYSKSIPQGGADASRSVEVLGTCTAVK